MCLRPPPGPQLQSLSAPLCDQHVEGGPAEQEEAICGPLLSLLHPSEPGQQSQGLLLRPDPLHFKDQTTVYIK